MTIRIDYAGPGGACEGIRSLGLASYGIEWRDSAACRGHDPDLWFPVRGGGNAAALAICEACPVKGECGEYGLSLGPHEPGIWGGLSWKQRRVILRERGWKPPIVHGTDRGYRAHRRRGEDACVECTDAQRMAAAERSYRYRENARGAS